MHRAAGATRLLISCDWAHAGLPPITAIVSQYRSYTRSDTDRRSHRPAWSGDLLGRSKSRLQVRGSDPLNSIRPTCVRCFGQAQTVVFLRHMFWHLIIYGRHQCLDRLGVCPTATLCSRFDVVATKKPCSPAAQMSPNPFLLQVSPLQTKRP